MRAPSRRGLTVSLGGRIIWQARGALAGATAGSRHALGGGNGSPMTRPRSTGAWWQLGSVAVGLLGLAAVLFRRLGRRMSERELRALVENAPDVVIRFDPALRIRYVNPMVE